MLKRNLIHPVLGLIIPGWGHAAQGKLKQAFLIQMTFYGALFLLAFSRLIVTVHGIYLFIFIFVGWHLYSAVSSAKNFDTIPFSSRKQKWLLVAFPLLCPLVLLAVFALKSYIFGFQLYKVTSVSMAPTLQDRDIVLVDTWHYSFNVPEVGDIVVFSLNGKDSIYIKRIMKKPDHLSRSSKDQLYLLGDNKGKSVDSRHFGLVGKQFIKGKMKLRFVRPFYLPQTN